MGDVRPPRWLERIAEAALPATLSGRGTVGDLAEEFVRRAQRSPGKARRWYAGQVISILTHRTFARDGLMHRGRQTDLWMDVRWSLRTMARNPAFSLGVVLVLGLGLGANVAVFSVVDGTFRNTSWWRDRDQTVAVWPGRLFSRGTLNLYQHRQDIYRSLGGWGESAFAVELPDGSSTSVNGVLITPELFRELAVQPVHGRALADDDGVPGGEPVAILGHALWRRAFGADPDIVGRRVRLNGSPTTVIGIQGPGARAPGGRAEVWVPHPLDPRDDDFFKAQFMDVVGVLNPGVGLEAAYDDLRSFAEYLTRIFPNNYRPGFWEGSASVAWADDAERRLIATPLFLLLGGTSLLLLVTALNVGNLLLGRSIDRRTELAVRTALGAGRLRIAQQLLVEGVVLTALAVAVGVGGAAFAGPSIAQLFVGETVVASSSVTTPTVLAFIAAAALGAWSVLCGVPILHFLRSVRVSLNVKPASGSRAQRSLVTVQAALATLLLVSATLLVQTVSNLRDVPLGFDPDRLLAVDLAIPSDKTADVREAQLLYDRLTERLRAIPGVHSVGTTASLPLRAMAARAPINPEAAPVIHFEAERAPKHFVDPGFFEAMGIAPLEGRVLTTRERGREPSAVVVNASLAARLWPDQSPVGQRIAIDPHEWDTWLPVVGVIPDIRSHDMIAPPGPAMYVALAEKPMGLVTLVVRAAGNPSALEPDIRRAVNEVDPEVPIRAVIAMADVVREAYSTSWVMMGLLIVLAVLATGLGAVGIYAVLAHHVSLHRREIGVRIALGAQPSTVIGGIVRSGLLLAGAGIVLGSAGAMVSNRLLESLLFGVSALTPWAFLAPAVALTAATAVAALVPAAQAGRLPPADVLRVE